MGVFDLTYEQYKTIVGSYAGSFTSSDGFETWPISGLSYSQFLNTVVRQLNSHVPGLNFGIPTEARLTFAMYGGAYDGIHGATSYDLVAWNKETVGATVSPRTVGTKCPNAYGLYDAIGNVNQIASDKNSGGSLPSTDVTEPQINDQTKYVARGGSYNDRYFNVYVTTRSAAISYSAGGETVGYRPYAR